MMAGGGGAGAGTVDGTTTTTTGIGAVGADAVATAGVATIMAASTSISAVSASVSRNVIPVRAGAFGRRFLCGRAGAYAPLGELDNLKRMREGKLIRAQLRVRRA